MRWTRQATLRRRWSVFLAFLLFLPAIAHAWIIIPPEPPFPPRPIPIPPPRAEIRPLEVTQHKVEVNIREGHATTIADLTFRNPNNFPYEAEFIFEVPGDAAVQDLTMFVDGKEVRAELLSSEEARKLYEDTVRRMRDPALLEIARERLIRASVFPVPAGGEQRIKLKYSHRLDSEDGLYSYRYPLKHRGGVGAACKKLSVLIRVESTAPIKSIVCPTHKVDVSAEGDREATISYEAEKVEPKEDLILHIAVSEKELGLKLLTCREKGKDGYFMAIVGAGYDVEKEEPVAEKCVVFAIDTSGSMSGEEKLEQVRKALKYCLTNLNRGDTFNIVDFSTTARTFKERPVPAEPKNIEEAQQYVDKLEARGGTVIADALKAAVEMGRGVETPYILLFLTDGKPTIGTDDTEQLVNIVKSANLKTLRLFTFGVGYEVNTHLLDRLAQENHGAPTYVIPGENIEHRVTALHKKISYPALTDIKLTFEGIRVYDVFPQEMPDLFVGAHVTVVGRYETWGDRTIVLTGKMRGETRRFVHEGTFVEENTTHDWLPRAWATRKIGYLLDQIRLRGDNKELKDEIVRLSKEFGIMTPYTSFLILEDEKARPDVPRPVPLRARVMAPAAVQEAESAGREFRRMEGKGAVDAAVSVQGMKASEGFSAAPETTVEQSLRQAMRQVAGRTYYLADGRWIVSTWDGKQGTVKVKYLSDEYFRLAWKHKQLAQAFALGAKVVAECEGKFYEVVE